MASQSPARRPGRFQRLASVLGNQAMQGLAQRGQLQILGPSGTITFDLAALGEGVPPALEDRRAVERRTGVDLSQVRVHDNREARRVVQAVDSELVTFGIDILRAAVATPAQMRHELAHIAQHGARPVDPSRPIVLGSRHSPEEHDAWSVAMGGEPQAVGDPNVARRDEEFDPSLEPLDAEYDPEVYPTDFGGVLHGPLPDLRIPTIDFTSPSLEDYIRTLGGDVPAAEPEVVEEEVPAPVVEPDVAIPAAMEPAGNQCVSCHAPTLEEPPAQPSIHPALIAALTQFDPGEPDLGAPPFGRFDQFEEVAEEDPWQAAPCPGSCHDIVNRPIYGRVPPQPSQHEIWQASMEKGSAEAIANEGQTVEETAQLVEMQVIAAQSRALGAAQAAGHAPPDLQASWQQALMAVENLKIAAPELAQPAEATATIVQVGGEPEAELDPELQETARDAIGAFYWGMIDALERLEAEQARRERLDLRRQALDYAQDPPGYRCQVNCHAPTGPVRSYYSAPPRRSPDVIERAGRVDTAGDIAAWRTAIADFEQTHRVDVQFLISETLPEDSTELAQLELAHRLQERLTALRADHPDMYRVPAVFYPEDDLEFEQQADGTSQQEAQGYSWYLFVYRDGNRIVLKDITSDTIYTNTEGVPDERTCPVFDTPEAQAQHDFPDAAMSDLFEQLNDQIRFPVGRLYYRWPGNRDGHVDTDDDWTVGDWLRAIGIALLAIGIILLTAGYGTPAAIALVGAGLVGAAATWSDLQELEQHGIATESDRTKAYVLIGLDLLSALTFGVGRIASAGATLGRLATFAGRVYLPLSRLNAIGNLAQIAVMTSDFASAFEQIGSMPDGPEKRSAMMRLIMVGLASGALSITSVRGDIADLTRGARPRLDVDVDGRLVRPDADLPPGATRPTIDDAQPGTSGWRGPPVVQGEPDPTIGAGSIVVEIRRRSDGLVTEVRVVAGRADPDPDDWRLHLEVAEMVRSYGGLQGRIRLAWREIQALFGRRRPPIEVELEIWKLEELVRRRVARVRDRARSTRERNAARDELVRLESRLAAAQRRARRAVEVPEAPTERAQIWMHDSPDGFPSRPDGMTWYRGRNNRWQLRSMPGWDHGGVQLRAVYDDAGNFTGEVTNRAQVARSRVIGRNVNEVRDRLTRMGYSVDVNGRISRRGTHRDRMIGLRADPTTGIIRESVAETSGQVQTRIFEGLNGTQQARVGVLRTAAEQAGNQEVVLIEGMYDLGCRWQHVIDTFPGGRDGFVDALELCGMSRADAVRITDGLHAKVENMQAIRGTAPLRSYDYVTGHTAQGRALPAGGDVHHGDPLYLAGTHELTVGLARGPHDAVHRFFNSLELPRGPLRGTRLSPNSLRARVPRSGWRRGAATIHHGGPTERRIDYEPL